MLNKKHLFILTIILFSFLMVFLMASCNPIEEDDDGTPTNGDSNINLTENDPFFLPPPKDNIEFFDYSEMKVAKITFVYKENIEKIVKIALFEDLAPITCENFIALANAGHYNNTIIHRLVHDFVLQGGGYYVEENNKRYVIKSTEDVPSIYGECLSNGYDGNAELLHESGVISMAKVGDYYDSATDQFFICLTKSLYLDGEFAAFGKCVDAMSLYNIIELGKSKILGISPNMPELAYPFIYVKSVEILEGNN